MGTRSVVAVRESNSVEITSAYVHYDGYLSGVGMTLLSAFNSAEGAREVVEGGYYSSLSENLEESLSGSANKEEAFFGAIYGIVDDNKHFRHDDLLNKLKTYNKFFKSIHQAKNYFDEMAVKGRILLNEDGSYRVAKL